MGPGGQNLGVTNNRHLDQKRRCCSGPRSQANAGDIYLLTGSLGAGKTCLTQGIAWGLGVPGYARSPTFVLMTQYQGRMVLHHVDLYRIGNSEVAWELGLEITWPSWARATPACLVEVSIASNT